MIASLLLLATVQAAQTEITPINKVIQMMQEMVAKGKQEKHDEQVAFSTFAQFCKDTMDQKQDAIKKETAAIEQLNADILKAQADQTQLADEIAVLEENIGSWETDKAKLTAERKEEKADYDALHADYTESIDALGRAIAELKKQSGSTPQGFLFLQKVSKLARIPASAKRTIMAFLSTKETTKQDPLAVSAPEASAYEFQSGGIVEMIEKLETKFKLELDGFEKEEMNAKHNFEMQIQELVNQIQQATDESALKTKVKSERAEDEATAKGDLATETSAKAADEKYLADLVTECDQKAKDYENRQMLRKDEIEAINKAIEIMSSDEVSGSGEKHLPQLIQLKSSTKTSMALLRSDADAPLRAKLVSFLSQRAQKFNSKLLLALATKAKAGGPFDKVKKMIKDLIVKLMEEATEESEHKGWCDTEMTTNKQTREDKADQVSTLSAQADELSAKISKLGSDMADLSDAIAEIDAAVAESTQIRTDEKAKNEVTIEEAKVAQVAVAKALTVLQEFYAKAADATSFAQGAADDAPATFDKPYTGMGGASGGIIGMLEVIESDFARLETETSTSESQAEEEYTKFMDDSSQDKAVKNMDLENKGKDKTTAEGDLLTTKNDLAATQTELDAALAYYDKLKPSCVDSGLSYEDRVRMREEEIQSLQEALRVLSGEDIA
jgi:predicted  nucleic acid-binding Zn-ribbon protein